MQLPDSVKRIMRKPADESDWDKIEALRQATLEKLEGDMDGFTSPRSSSYGLTSNQQKRTRPTPEKNATSYKTCCGVRRFSFYKTFAAPCWLDRPVGVVLVLVLVVGVVLAAEVVQQVTLR